MDAELLAELRAVTEEEQAILDGRAEIERERYTDRREFVVDSAKLLQKGRLIEIRPHTRFVRFPRHRHNYVELVYMCAGETTHIINGRETLTLREGDLLFLNQTAFHEILPAGRDDIAVNFIILPEFFDRSVHMLEQESVLRDFLLSTLSGQRGAPGYLHVAAREILPVQNLLENMIWTLRRKSTIANTLNQTTMGLLLLNLAQYAQRIDRGDPNRQEENQVFLALKYIETHYRAGTLEEIAQQLRLPPYALSRLLKKHTGQNFKALLGERKLQQAAYLLGNTSLSVDGIKESIGYENNSFFYRKFRERFGQSPAEYRRAAGGLPPRAAQDPPGVPAEKDAPAEKSAPAGGA